MSPIGGLCSENGNQGISSKEECGVAARKLGYISSIYSTRITPSYSRYRYPKGCYIYGSQDSIYFNTHTTGSAQASSRPICEYISKLLQYDIVSD